jgi:hypothetical protein
VKVEEKSNKKSKNSDGELNFHFHILRRKKHCESFGFFSCFGGKHANLNRSSSKSHKMTGGGKAWRGCIRFRAELGDDIDRLGC